MLGRNIMSDRGKPEPNSVLPVLDQDILEHLGNNLRREYTDPLAEKVPATLLRLLKRTAEVIRARQEPLDKAFVDEMMAVLPQLRVYAISLEKDHVRADDLVQETIVKALANYERFEMGTCLRSWLFTILKNQFFTLIRRRGREVEDVDGFFAQKLTVAPDQHDKLSHCELIAAMDALRDQEREVLLMVALDGLSYEEAAARMGCAVGTIKSRVNRARKHLAENMGLAPEDIVGGNRFSTRL
jgi:RNA polymerase sigma-70 factor (ECF subfamily)